MTAALGRIALAAPMLTYATANGLAVEWPNKAFNKPVEGLSWVRFTVVEVTAKQLEMGSTNNQHRVYGTLILQIFAPADAGDGASLALGDTLGELYRQQILNFSDSPVSGHVRMRDPNVRSIGRSNAYWQTNVTVPFQRDDIFVLSG